MREAWRYINMVAIIGYPRPVTTTSNLWRCSGRVTKPRVMEKSMTGFKEWSHFLSSLSKMGLLEGGGSWRFHFQCYFVLFCVLLVSAKYIRVCLLLVMTMVAMMVVVLTMVVLVMVYSLLGGFGGEDGLQRVESWGRGTHGITTTHWAETAVEEGGTGSQVELQRTIEPRRMKYQVSSLS